jgi:hypothetical protein
VCVSASVDVTKAFLRALKLISGLEYIVCVITYLVVVVANKENSITEKVMPCDAYHRAHHIRIVK